MNKLAKGAVAGAAGIALLLGGAGSFALWNDSAQVNASTITSGTLTVKAPAAGTWTDVTNGRNAAIPAISNFLIVPGNTVKFTQVLNVTATGNDLKAELTYDPASITGTLKGIVGVDLAVTSANANVVAHATTPNTFVVTPAVGTSAVTVTVTVTLPASTAGVTGQASTLDLSGLTFTLTQKSIS